MSSASVWYFYNKIILHTNVQPNTSIKPSRQCVNLKTKLYPKNNYDYYELLSRMNSFIVYEFIND